ncbi:MAG: ABC-F family ATP-binding cassette domain-containing protein [Spirochaetaceae bacterium]|nr:ABC-F family ATP-binding cassette domain-containing protein [Spirochaetaceae bacterium]
MNLLQINNLSFSYPSSSTVLFNDFSLQLQDRWTVIAGSNGCGKTTLLKLIAGILVPDSGIIRTEGEIVYCSQGTLEIPHNLYTAFWSSDNQVRRFFSILNVSEQMLERYENLSGGEKKRIQIACALAENPSVLLLDEPTNHLDKETVQMILQALQSYSGTGICVSHDRGFTDALCTKTVYLYKESQAFASGRDCVVCEVYNGGLSKALELRNAEKERMRSEWDGLDKKASVEKQKSRELEEEIRKSQAKLSKRGIDAKDHDARFRIDSLRVGGVDRVAGDAKARQNSLVSRTEQKRDSAKKALKRKEGFSVDGLDYTKPVIIDETDITVGNGENAYTLHIPSVEIDRSSKIALTGQNGSGKTLFINHIISVLQNNGRLDQILYLPQEITEEQGKAVLQVVDELDEAARGDVFSTLYRLGSEPENLSDSLISVSPGELRKLMISLGITHPLALLILDEPTNHMDITSVMALEEALAGVNCPMLIVSHDETFLSKITNARFAIERIGNRGTLKKC